MDVNLRKANALEKSLLSAAGRQPLGRSINISIYKMDDIEGQIAAASEKLATNVKAALALTAASYSVRAKISAKNAECGVNALLSELALLEAKEKLLTAVSGATGSADVEVVKAKLEALKARSASDTRGYGATEELAVSLGTADEFSDYADDLIEVRRRKTAIADELLMLNTTTKITLSQTEVGLLTDFKLI